MPPSREFETHRARLFGQAYRPLGSASEAEDMVQEAYLRWAAHDDVAAPGAWLTTVVTNLCLTHLTSARARRERYIGTWLPEPVLTGAGALAPLETVEQREQVSFGLLVLLERLTPRERAVFVLREAFGYSHREVGVVLGLTEANSWQLHARARYRLGRDGIRYPVDTAERERLVRRFLAATVRGDVAELARLLAEQVRSTADGGGEVTAARRPIVGRDRVARYLGGMSSHPAAAGLAVSVAEVNGQPAGLFHVAGRLAAVLLPDLADGAVVALRLVRNPAKLRFLAAQRHESAAYPVTGE